MSAAAELPFHPLADLFPLIEGAEFDELVSSVKENGLLEPIIILDGAILDGRNRYRACIKAAIDPQFEEFSGADPIRFVAAKNVTRRHLTASQRAVIAAAICNFSHGSNQFQRKELEFSSSSAASSFTVSEAAQTFGVSEDLIYSAKVVLKSGTAEEVSAVKNGGLNARLVADAIRKNSDPKQRAAVTEKAKAERHVGRIQTQQMQADIWLRLKEALENLTALPLPAEVIAIARNYDKRTKGAAIAQRLPSALEWLREFSDAWNNRRD